jgi:hypothetical protein
MGFPIRPGYRWGKIRYACAIVCVRYRMRADLARLVYIYIYIYIYIFIIKENVCLSVCLSVAAIAPQRLDGFG